MKTTDQKARRAALFDNIKLSIINNLVLASVLLGFGAFINHQFEKNRTHESFVNEFNKIKAQKIGDSWAELSEWEVRTSIILELNHQAIENHKKNIPISEREKLEFSKLVDETYGYDKLFLIERNRYWVGQEHYLHMEEFSTLITRKSDNYINYNQDSLMIINKLIEEKRMEIDEVVSSMLEKRPPRHKERMMK